MRPASLPPVPYTATARRPGWDALPAGVRAAIAGRLGSGVIEATSAGGGFTRGFASVLRTAAGERVFVKAARLDTERHLVDWYTHEAAITAAMPASVRVARPRWSLTAGGYVAVGMDAVDGHIPALPWKPAELTAALEAWGTVAAALREPPAGLLALRPPSLADLLRSDLSYWQWIAAGHLPMPPAPPAATARLPELAALEAALPGYLDTPGLTHGDLRLDNVLIDRDGAAWLCDWNWLCRGAPWFDTATLLVTAYASGLDADALFAAHPTSAGAPAEALDATLATLAGYWLCRGADEPTDASPHLRAHHRWSGEQALAWLTTRRPEPRPPR